MPNAADRKKLLADAVRRSTWDPAFFMRFFLAHWFPSDMPAFHLGIIAVVTKKVEFLNHYPDAHEFLLSEFKYAADPADPESAPIPVFYKGDDGKIRMVVGDHANIIVPRGFSKTTLLNGCNLYEAVTDGTIFAVYISKSSPHAETQIGNIRIELETNALLREAYGNMVPTRADVEKWQSDELQLLNGAILIARGRGGQVRGLNYRARRPNRIVLDDVEDDDGALSATERQKTENWFYSAVEKAGQLMEGAAGESWAQSPLRIVNLGTLLGAECLMVTLSKDPKFSTVKFGAKLSTDPNDTRMLWPFKLSYQTYMAERERHRLVGKLNQFTREIDSSIRLADDQLFPEVFIYRYHTRDAFLHVAQALDPAISNDPKADHAALVTVGRLREGGGLVVLDEWGGTGKTPTEKVNQFFENHIRWQTTHNGIEAIQYQTALLHLMNEEMPRRRLFFEIVPIRHPKTAEGKVGRIQGLLSPRYMRGYIQHQRRLSGLEGNLADWPNGKKDYADACAMALTLLGESSMLTMQLTPEEQAEYDRTYSAPLPPAIQPVSGYILHSRTRSAEFRRRYG